MRTEMKAVFVVVCLIVVMIALSGLISRIDNNSYNHPSFKSVSLTPGVIVSPALVYLKPGQTYQFTANVPVTWAVTSGTITASGLYTAGIAGISGNAAVTASTSTSSAKAIVNVIVPPLVYKSRTDIKTTLLQTVPNWGGAIGVNKQWIQPAYGSTVIRCTDRNSIITHASVTTADSGEPNIWEVSDHHILLKTPQGKRFVIAFDPVTLTCNVTPITFTYDSVQFSTTDPNMLWAIDGTKLRTIVVASDYSKILSDTVTFDFNSAGCLPGITPKWISSFITPLAEDTWRVGFSTTGGQGSGVLAAAWNKNKGCAVYNSLAATVTINGITKPADDGKKPLKDKFYLHEYGGGKNGDYALLTYSLHQPNNQPGCIVGNCAADSPYIWETFTTHVLICGLHKCEGHGAQGVQHLITGSSGKFILHTFSNPALPLTQLNPTVNNKFGDFHGSWLNTYGNDPVPMFATTADLKVKFPYPTYWYNEGIALAMNGTVYRFFQTANSGTSPYFVGQWSNGVISQSGKYAAYTSDMCGKKCKAPFPLGTDNLGNPGVDVFVAVLN